MVTPKELAELADVCRKKGIESIKITENTVEFQLGQKQIRRRDDGKVLAQEQGLSDDEIATWSSNG